MLRTLSTSLLFVFVTGALLARPASSQESTTRGLLLGAHLGGASLTVENSDRGNGGGGGITIGYGLNRRFTIFVQIDGSSVDVRNQLNVEGTWAIAHADLGVRFNFANSLRRWVPYLQGALTGRAVSVTDVPATNPISNGEDITFSGSAFTFGGGVMLYPTQTLAVDFGLLFSGGEFTEINFGNNTVSGLDIDAQSSRFGIGVSWWP